MATWSNRPPESETVTTLPLRRTPPAGVLELLITSSDLVGRYTHYYQGRTLPCDGPDCPACADGLSSRWHGWVSGVNQKTKEHIILELTAAPAKILSTYRDDHGTLRGACVRCNRYNGRPNGRIHLTVYPVDLTTRRLPPPPNMTAVLIRIWGAEQLDPAVPAEAAQGIAQQLAARIGGNNRNDPTAAQP